MILSEQDTLRNVNVIKQQLRLANGYILDSVKGDAVKTFDWKMISEVNRQFAEEFELSNRSLNNLQSLNEDYGEILRHFVLTFFARCDRARYDRHMDPDNPSYAGKGLFC